jgi:hypothetical protein
MQLPCESHQVKISVSQIRPIENSPNRDMKQFNRPLYIGLIRQWDDSTLDSTDRRQFGTKSGETESDIETYTIPGTVRPALTPNGHPSRQSVRSEDCGGEMFAAEVNLLRGRGGQFKILRLR